ncbi:DUF3078 domain-containing protein [Paludibacter sp. 221]|uniref:DUF3078 domain-containing protein n=1 Tax=Paludibacter sp. 221 TaxID=2302939 RepID=UPI0013D48F9D|nr:DUF3078 domain-containing protein [Paludibacter sp. 221]
MRFKIIFLFLFFAVFFQAFAEENIKGAPGNTPAQPKVFIDIEKAFNDSLQIKTDLRQINLPDSVKPDLKHGVSADTLSQKAEADTVPAMPLVGAVSANVALNDSLPYVDSVQNTDTLVFVREPFVPVMLDSIVYVSNPLFNELVYMEKDVELDWKKDNPFTFHTGLQKTLTEPLESIDIPSADETLFELRNGARAYIAQTKPELYKKTSKELPKVSWSQFQAIVTTPVEQIQLDEEHAHVPVTTSDRIIIRRKKISPWVGRANSLLQFSQTYISPNWHKGGNNFTSILGVLSGRLDYDNKKKIKWENSAEWRAGFNSVDGDTVRFLNPNDDVFKIYSKFGLKATGNFYYSTSAEFQTQFFENPKAVNSHELKAAFLTPIRVNINVGMDYKYKKLSVVLSPVSFKYIYATDTVNVNPNQFGIKSGENNLKEIGSRLVVELKDYRPIQGLKLNSKFNFYTNYEKVEIDWEIVAELAINRFLSTRLMLNPRFDNTVIMPDHEKAKIQMKEMLTVGFSYRLY